MKDNAQELLPIVDESGRQIGTATRGECHGGSMLLHPVVHLHVFNSEGDLYLQKRPLWKDIQPGRWDALRREAREELELDHFDAEPLTSYIFESDRERELVNAFKTVIDDIPRPTDELDGGRFWTCREILAALGHDILTPNFEKEYARLFINSGK